MFQQSHWIAQSIGLAVGHIKDKTGGRQLVMGCDRLSSLSKHKNEGGKKRNRLAFLTVGCLKFMPKCIRGCYSLILCTRIYGATYRKRRDLLANQLIMVTHCPFAIAGCHAACTLTAHLLHTVDRRRPLFYFSSWRTGATGIFIEKTGILYLHSLLLL